MGLIRKLKRLTVGRVEAFLDKAEDPAAVYPELLRELEQQVRAAANAEAKARSALSAAQRKRDELTGRINRLTEGASLAIKQGNEDLAREAVEAQMEAEKRLPALEEEMARADTAVLDAGSARQQLEDTLQELTNRKGEMLAHAQMVRAQKGSIDSQRSVSARGKDILSAVARMEEKVEQAEAEHTVRREAGASRTPALEQKLREFEQDAELETRLAALKKQRSGKDKKD